MSEEQFFNDQNADIKDELAESNSGENLNGQIDANGSEQMNEDSDLFELKQRVKGMDEEAARLIQLQSEMEQQMKSTQSPTASKLLKTVS
jgi:hypothetical protein